ncbi:SMI1/KNR4 family protein [Thermodesulforhabdus norvegica]|uniref:Knr4/Smi1-like domain-containing protein n=1 Tax=Thermodesulforhabdus norvegica TaxID=39841 RepID=A0A1I4V1S5_9BACT|nr:SMI1/KNR4 family protein [Thermodesulforhabdus norvegica]SFM95169.1 hypothetical protein SAMN05660836_02098 [Thermodesulforhabdus norvegica]
MNSRTSEKRISIQDFVKKELGVRLPDPVVRFLVAHEECLSDNPYDRSRWKSGFGDVHFICGTTRAFREQFENFPRELIIIGYLGEDSVIIDHRVNEMGLYVAVDVRNNGVYIVDSLGKAKKVGDSFSSWIEHFVSCLKDHPGETDKESFLKHIGEVLRRWRNKET